MSDRFRLPPRRSLVFAGLGGLAGGAVGFAATRLIEFGEASRGDDLSLRQGYWFAVVVVGLGSGVIAGSMLGAHRRPSGRDVAVALAALVVGGFLSGYLAQAIYDSLLDEAALKACFRVYRADHDDSTLNWCYANTVRIPRTAGWLIAGLVSGVGVGAAFRSGRRVANAAVGGAAGGLVGGLLFDTIPALLGLSSLAISQGIAVVLIGVLTALVTSLIDDIRSVLELEVLNGEARGRRYVMAEDEARIGRSRSLELCVPGDRNIAELHARVMRSASGVVIAPEQGSVILNGGQVGHQVLSDGDVIEIGSTQLKVTLRRPSEAVVTPAGATMDRGGSPSPAPRVSIPTQSASTATHVVTGAAPVVPRGRPTALPTVGSPAPPAPSPIAPSQPPPPPAPSGSPVPPAVPAQPSQRPRLPTKDS